MRRKRRKWMALVLALVSGGAAGYLALGYMNKPLSPRTASASASTQIVVAARDLALGTVLAPGDVKTIAWPSLTVPPGYAASEEQVIGRGLITPVSANEPLMTAKLADKEAGGGLPIVIPEGMRAVSVKVDEVIGVAGFVLPGTRVDVLVTLSDNSGREEAATRLILQNVQTLAATPWIVRNGPAAFTAVGGKGSPGTILVQVRGPGTEGIAEVPLTTPLRKIVKLAGKLPKGHKLKALLVGGPSGGLLPPDLLDTPYDFDSLRAAGAHLGSGSVVIADDRACVVDLARLLTRFCSSEACGKSIPCRIGTRRLAEIGDRIVEGRPRQNDLGILADLSADIVGSALCDHERLATLPLGSGMRYFRAELDDHLLRSSCPAGVCQPIAVAAGTTQ